MSEETNGEMADWERAWEQESALGRFGYAVQNLKEVVRERIRHKLAEPILDYLVGSPDRLYVFVMALIGLLLMLIVLSGLGK